jgi:hypothetical protein
MSGLPEPTFGGVTLNAIELDAPGRRVLNSYVLMDGARRRRKNEVRPNVDGVLGSKGFKDPRDVDLEVYLDGQWDSAGSPAVDEQAAVASHIIYLRQNILDDPGDDEGAVDCVVESAVAGYTHEGPVQVNDLVQQPGIGAQIITIPLTLIRGELDIIAGS